SPKESRRAGVGSPARASRAELLLANVDDLHDLHFLTVNVLVHVRDDSVLALDDDLVAATDLLAGERTAFLCGAGELRPGGVASDEARRRRAAQAARSDGGELLLPGVIAEQAQALERLARGGAFALDGFLDETTVHDPLAFDSPLQFRRWLAGVRPHLEG